MVTHEILVRVDIDEEAVLLALAQEFDGVVEVLLIVLASVARVASQLQPPSSLNN